jgi:hypothetical protein
MPDLEKPAPDRGSLIDGIRKGNARQWERFSHFYAGWIKERAGRRLSPNHMAWTDDVTQAVILRLLRQNDRKPNPDQDLARFRADLARAVAAECRKVTADPNGPRSAERPSEDAEEIVDTDELLKALKGVLQRVRTNCQPTDAIAWQCFEDRLLRSRPAAEIAEWYKTSRSLVYINIYKIVQKILTLLREDYREQFPDQGALFRKLEELKRLPEMREDVSGDALADELKATDAIKIDADSFFRRRLREHWPVLKEEAEASSPEVWAGFLAHVRAVSLGESPAKPGPEIERMIAKVDRYFRQRCKADQGALKLYHHFRLRPDAQGIDADAVARLCGSFSREGSTDVDAKLPR